MLPVDADPREYILGANVERRHMSASARAMAVVMAYRTRFGAEHRTAFDKGERKRIARKTGAGADALKKARTVAEYAPHHVQSVINGGSLNDAYAEALRHKAQQEEEAKAFAALQKSDPDLATNVDRGIWTRAQAIAAKAAVDAERAREGGKVPSWNFAHAPLRDAHGRGAGHVCGV